MLLRIEGLRFAYPGGEEALAGVSLELRHGQRTALLGPNGAGKSTLLLHLNGVLGPDPRVVFEGTPLSRRSLRQVRRRVGLVFQDCDDQLFLPTVWEDVAFGPRNLGLPEEEVARRVHEALAAVGLDGFEDRPPHRLSGGEKRRAALATVLSMRPSLLALDEPAGSLDARSRRRLVRVLRGVDAAMLVATHDLELAAALCERCLVMDGGRIVAAGQTAELLSREALLVEHGLLAPSSPIFPAGAPRG